MQLIADLQLHSKYSRAVSQEMIIPKMYEWNLKKGIGLLATGDWTHPLWIRELKANLTELGNGLLKIKQEAKKNLQFDATSAHGDPLFLLSGEVSCIYSHNGKLRRNHILLFAPSFAVVDKINAELTRRGCNLSSDGRPILGLTSQNICEIAWSISPEVLVVPAHCLLPDQAIITEGFNQELIKDITVKSRVLTHTGTFKEVTEVKKRLYKGTVLKIKAWYFSLGLTTTPEHPYYAIKTLKKCPSTGDLCRPSKSHLARCKQKSCLAYKPEWIEAKDLESADVLVYPRTKINKPTTEVFIDQVLPQVSQKQDLIISGGTRGRKITNKIPITLELGRLIGYFLAEGSTDGDNSFSFCFSRKEKDYIDDVLLLVKTVFNLDNPRIYKRTSVFSVEITYYSKIHAMWLSAICYKQTPHKAFNKKIPDFLLHTQLPIQAELLRGWHRGDKGYTSSRTLMNQMKAVCLQLDIIPSIILDSKEAHAQRANHHFNARIITARQDNYSFSNFAFFSDEYDLKKEIKRAQAKIDRRHGWIDENNIYIPIKEIKKSNFEGEVYNLEVANDHSYVSEFAAVHNCWTPWFSLFGSMSGYDSLEECFGQFSDRIYAIETGLSSDPAMNWRIPQLDSKTLISSSDAHSGPKLMREATIFAKPGNETFSFADICIALQNYNRDKTKAYIAATLEFYPEEGKYHFDGHRNCNIHISPSETKEKGTLCPVCGKPLTIGVLHRVEDLAGRSEADLKLIKKQLGDFPVQATYSETFPTRAPYIMMVPLAEIIAESLEVQAFSKKVQELYTNLVRACGGEFTVLFKATSDEITKAATPKIAEGVDKVRRGDIVIAPGYDGVFGVVKIWESHVQPQAEDQKEQLSLL